MFEVKSSAFDSPLVAEPALVADALRVSRRRVAATSWREKLAVIDFTPALDEEIGSRRWFRGLATFSSLAVVALSMLPDFGPLYGAQAPAPKRSALEELKSQAILPIDFGNDSGKHMAATDAVVALPASPERPSIELTVRLGASDSIDRLLERAGVGSADLATAMAMISGVTPPDAIPGGTSVEIILGKRTASNAPRPLESLKFRARFDLYLEIARHGGALSLKRQDIAVSNMPLRIRGKVGAGLYRSARAAGAPPNIIQDYLKLLVGRMPLTSISPEDEFDIIIAHRRAATGESQTGDLLYVGLDRGTKSLVEMVNWSGRWLESAKIGKTNMRMGLPVNGRMTSPYGMRMHPILHYRKMHTGIDFGAPWGSPIFAASDGVISYAGHKGGYGNFVQVEHGGGIATGYGHMSRIAAVNGRKVKQGQVIGYVGSSGMSTGPHLHYELYRNGQRMNPASMNFVRTAQVNGDDQARFRSLLAKLKAVKPGAALR